MKFNFKNFRFDCDLQILTKDGNTFSLNEKPAQLLTLFLCEANKIHSKADILESVWPDRVVTDQVVFQNISYLRAVFGNDAIKTFTKKGYQWQLPLSEVVPDEIVLLDQIKPENDIKESFDLGESDLKTVHLNKARVNWALIYFVLITSIAAIGVFLLKSTGSDSSTIIEKPQTFVSILPVIQVENNKSIQELNAFLSSNKQAALIKQNQLTGQALFDSPFKTWQSLSQSDEQLLLTYKIYSLADETVLRFYLQGKYRGWQGYIVDDSIGLVAIKLNQLLEMLQSSVYFSLKSANAALAQLTLLHNTQPNNQLLTQKLIQFHYELDDFDVANALVDHELKKPQHILNRGLYHQLKVNIANKNSNWPRAQKDVEETLRIFTTLNLPQLESTALIQASWFAFLNQENQKSREYLNTAANKARIAQEPLQEVKAHLTQSFMASKMKQTALMHSHLDIAKRLITLHQLNDEHQISVLSNLAWSTHSRSEELAYYQQILEAPFSALYIHDYYSAADFVRLELIAQKKYQQVLASIKPWQRESFAILTRAQIKFANKEWQSAMTFAMQAFEAARIAHEHYDALDAALLLIQYQSHLSKGDDIGEYVNYISKNASKRWRRINRVLIKDLGYW